MVVTDPSAPVTNEQSDVLILDVCRRVTNELHIMRISKKNGSQRKEMLSSQTTAKKRSRATRDIIEAGCEAEIVKEQV